MKRGYTVEDYREMLARIRETVPDAAVTSDFIVGFCGETDDDFQQTVDLVRECRFKNSFIFKYSERPGTKGAELYADDVPDEVKRRRNNELLAAAKRDQRGRQPGVPRPAGEVLVEGPSKAAETSTRMTTRHRRRHRSCSSPAARTATASSSSTATAARSASFLPVAIYDANAHTLFGEVVTQHVGPELYTLARYLAWYNCCMSTVAHPHIEITSRRARSHSWHRIQGAHASLKSI